MQIKLFTIPIAFVNEQNDELNKFLKSHKILEIDKQLVQIPTGAFWCFYIQYVEEGNKEFYIKENKVDYRETLTEEEFKAFSKLREIRKKISVEDAVSAFVVFTDAELAEIAKLKDATANNIRSIKGIGDKKAEKYGERILSQLKSEWNEPEI